MRTSWESIITRPNGQLENNNWNEVSILVWESDVKEQESSQAILRKWNQIKVISDCLFSW